MLKRDVYIPYIVGKFAELESAVKISGRLNFTNIHIHAESFFCHLLNHMYEANFQNANIDSSNEEAIDLKDNNIKKVIQVTSNKTKRKIEGTLSKEILKELKEDGFELEFLFIHSDCKNLKKQNYKNPYEIEFSPENSLIDLTDLLRIISNFEIDKLSGVYIFFRKEFGDKISQENTTRNLTILLKLLSQENLDIVKSDFKLNTYKINEKIEYNKLEKIKDSTIEQNKIYMGLLERLYKQFDEQGMNKSLSIFSKLSSFYEEELTEEINNKTNVTIFFNIINKVIDYVKSSDNYEPIPEEELELCARIIVVHAFIRCKVFENPGGYNYVASD